MARARFETVDSLRALAALAVLLGHVALASGHGLTWHGLADRFNVGVPIFFAISGFVLYRPFVAARADGRPSPDLTSYGVRRFLRIVPAYWLALTVLAIWPGLDNVFSRDFWVYYGFLQIYGHLSEPGQGLFPAWTLCIEVTFYALLPLYARWIASLARGRVRGIVRAELIGLGAVALAAAAARAGMALDGLRHPEWFMWLIIDADWFLPGMAMAVASVHLQRRGRAGVGPRGALASGGVALAAFVVLWRGNWDRYHSVVDINVEAWLYLVVAAALLLPLTLGDGRGVIARVMKHRLLVWLGMISYGIYLWHYPLAFWTWGNTGSVPLALGLTLALTIAAAAASWYLLEKPLLRLGRAYTRRRAARTPAAEPSGELAATAHAAP
jgi:peptidoglycan/LPS O-acetylase OafA/YrhL